MDMTLISWGDEIKATRDGRVSGYLVRFGSPRDTDLEGDYFAPTTDFGRPAKSGDTFDLNLYYHHGLDAKVGRKAIGRGTVTVDDVGLWYEAQIDMSDEYREAIADLAQKKRLGFSSGAAGHLVVREPSGVGKSHRIACWPLGEASLTPQPAEPRNMATVKSLTDLLESDDAPARPTTIKELERRLREALSLSRREAATIASKAWPVLSDSDDGQDEPGADPDGVKATSDATAQVAASTDTTRRDLLRRAMEQQARAQA